MFHRIAVISIAIFFSSAAAAQTRVDVSGHWEGAVQTPTADMPFALDLTTTNGILGGTFSGPDLTGIPLLDVTLNGRTVAFHVRKDQDFMGMLLANGTSIQGNA